MTSRYCFCLLALGMLPELVSAQAGSVYPLFADDTPLRMNLAAPLQQLKGDDDERPERPAVLSLIDANGSERRFDIEARVRGRSRRDICEFPPLRIDFDRESTTDSVFAGQDHLKLVNVCIPSNDDHHDYLALEYLIYRMLNTLTEMSFRVRWATIEYIDTDGENEPFLAPAFLVEEDWAVAERTGLALVEEPSLAVASYDPSQLAMIAVFQFLIGNTDWGVLKGPEGESCCHNSKVLGTPAGRRLALPYDFDFSGLINATYATPDPDLNLNGVTQRLYRGFCALNSELPAAVELVQGRREVIEDLFEDDRVSSSARSRAQRFLRGSFGMIDRDSRVESNLERACR
jgi:hypothetical protein